MTPIDPEGVDVGTNSQDLAEKAQDDTKGSDSDEAPKEPDASPWDWNKDPENPYNWPAGRKATQIAITASIAFLA
jgi:hypothetical protein